MWLSDIQNASLQVVANLGAVNRSRVLKKTGVNSQI